VVIVFAVIKFDKIVVCDGAVVVIVVSFDKSFSLLVSSNKVTFLSRLTDRRSFAASVKL
jgi:hypothetical protein